MAKQDTLGFLGLLYVAHKAYIGEEMIDKFSKMKIIIMAKDATSSQATSTLKKAERMHLPVVKAYDEETLGRALGHEKVTFIGIIDSKAAAAFTKKAAEGDK
ncbi:MAG: hypothetical protein LKJ81_01305 [Bacilli bacterium]|jgi:ribosomal protein L7Ae-like RNA K-turn-binding protein|nr:hypothetical protein [Bacilli bacterium]MCI2054781.1 hypothetical protein [Bacilli bacterium]